MLLDRFLKSQQEIEITVNDIDYIGWLNAGIERSIEQIGSTFSINVGRMANGEWPDIKRQDEVEIKIGDTKILTGIVLAAEPFYSGHDDYGIRVDGRDRTGDLITGSAIYKGGQWFNAKVDRIAKDICTPFGIDVVISKNVDLGKPLQKFELENGEPVADAISRAAKYRGILVTSNMDGNLLLTTAGSDQAPAGLVLGENVISMSAQGTDADRGSEYIVQGQDEINNQGSAAKARNQEFRTKDKEIKRYLPIIIQADDGGDRHHMQNLAEHTARIRAGRAHSYRFTVEGWEVNGTPWQPNQMVAITDQVLGYFAEPLLIVSVNVSVDRNGGDITEISVAPKEAYEQLPMPEETSSGKAKKKAGKAKKKAGKAKKKGKKKKAIVW